MKSAMMVLALGVLAILVSVPFVIGSFLNV